MTIGREEHAKGKTLLILTYESKTQTFHNNAVNG